MTSLQPLTASDLEALAKSRLFRGVDIELVDHLLQECTLRDLRADEILLARGEAPSEDLFVVMSGRVSVHLAGAESPSHTVIDAGECVGEMSAIDGEPISATVMALEAARLLVIPEPIVWSLVNSSHAVARNLLYILSRRMRHGNAVIAFGLDRQRELERAAGTDGLTGLHNRRWMNEAFARQLDRCARDTLPSSLILIDVDTLKAYNDQAGHLAGDLLICTVADVLARHIRPGDLLARFGGDEFCLLLPETPLSDALTAAERLRAAVDAEVVLEIAVPATISCGVSSGLPGVQLEELFHIADGALYRAKSKGRNTVAR
ncbi:MAG: GGDEF domain-containing protein [Burkholderiales bacterium]